MYYNHCLINSQIMLKQHQHKFKQKLQISTQILMNKFSLFFIFIWLQQFNFQYTKIFLQLSKLNLDQVSRILQYKMPKKNKNISSTSGKNQSKQSITKASQQKKSKVFQQAVNKIQNQKSTNSKKINKSNHKQKNAAIKYNGQKDIKDKVQQQVNVNDIANVDKQGEIKKQVNYKNQKLPQEDQKLVYTDQLEQQPIQIESSEIDIDEQQVNVDNNNYGGHVGFDDLVGQEIQQCKSYRLFEEIYMHILPLNQFLKMTVNNYQNLKHGSENLNVKFNTIFDPQITTFLINSKKYQSEQFVINKPIVFKVQKPSQEKIVHNSKHQEKNKSKSKANNRKYQDMIKFIKQTLVKLYKQLFEVNCNQSSLLEFLQKFNQKQHALITTSKVLQFSLTLEPFLEFPESILQNKNSTIILGIKNSGKSTLAEFIKNKYPQETCILDCDIGRNLLVPACISLITPQQNISIWVGQYTPLNCISTYKRAIQYLYLKYRQKYFTKKLIINTMGYITGLGEILLYEIYNIINPTEIIVLSNDRWPQSKEQNLDNILFKIKSGKYYNNLLFKTENSYFRKRNQNTTLQIYKMNNPHSQSKGVPIRFQNLIKNGQNIKGIYQLIKAIKRRQFRSISHLQLFQQDKMGNLTSLEWNGDEILNMRVVLLGKFLQNIKNSSFTQFQNQTQEAVSPLIEILGVGFGLEGEIFYDQNIIKSVICPQVQNLKTVHPIGLLCQGIDFQKYFYQISQTNLIKLQLQYGKIDHISPIIKGLGTKGLRNSSLKKD